MDARAFDKSKLPSRHVTEGPTRAPHRSNLENVKFDENQKVVFAVSKAISTIGGVVGLKGSRAPEGAIVKVAGMKTLQFSGPARVFDCEEDCFRAVGTRDDKTGEILAIRYEGPQGGPGLREMLSSHVISIDAEKGARDLEVGPAEFDRRRAAWGAVTHAGGKAEVVCYADI